jgi:NADH-quinone oxidoreductase subunit J
MISLFQIILGFLVLVSAINTVASKNPIVSAMSLMATLFLSGIVYIGLGQFFLGAAQILIYAGAISVLFVFIVMLLDLKATVVQVPGFQLRFLIQTLAILLFGFLLVFSFKQNIPFSETASSELSTQPLAKDISVHFLTQYMFPFQLTGFLILSALIGVIFIGRSGRQQS